MQRRSARSHPIVLVLAAMVLPCAGCPVTAPLPTQAQIQEYSLPDGGSKYFLYIPSTYERKRTYPLVILCHGTNPWDSAYAQIQEWAMLAEQKGIIVAAPLLVGTHGDFRPPVESQLSKQNEDEHTILQLVSGLKGSRNIAEEQVFLTGWSAGSFAVLHTGLRNPDVFRALAIRQGTFEASFMQMDADRLDRWQPIFIYYGSVDPLREESVACIRWLREHELFVEQREVPGSHRRLEARIAWDFFKKITHERPWIRLHAAKTDSSNRGLVRFWCEAKPTFTRLRWNFGDGQTSNETSPIHTYAGPGRYEVFCDVKLKGGHAYRRRTIVQIGQAGEGENPGAPN